MPLLDLNSTQQKVVLHTTGPALVIAGAGTGKTRVLTERMRFLMQDQKVPGNSLLALTFTEKATFEMQERIDQVLPIGHDDLWIHTFHAFCDRLLRERGIEIGLDPGYTLLTQADQWMFLKKHLFAFALDYYRPLGNPTRFLALLLNHFSRLKDEMVQPEAYLAFAEKNLHSARSTEDLARIEDAEKTVEIAHAYTTYQQLLQKESCVDFGDLLLYTVQLLEKRPSTLAYYQKQFQYIMVDEFQDTNYVQNYLVMLLAKQHRSLMVVGDDDQSIYKWRGASLTNMQTFLKYFPETQLFVLQENYRSTPAILDVAYTLIQGNNPDRLEIQQKISKKLVACAPSEKNAAPQILHYTHYLEEVNGVVSAILNGLAAGRSPNEFAILVRANMHAEPFVKALQSQNLPVHVAMQGGLFSQEISKDFIALLRLIADPTDDRACFRVLALSAFGLSMPALLDFTQHAKQKYQSYFDALCLKVQKENTQQELFSSDEKETLKKIVSLLQELIEKSRHAPTSTVLRTFLDRTALLPALEQTDPESLEYISAFSKLVQNFENISKDTRVADFIDYLALLEEAGENPAARTELSENSINILTVHSAKGLEFPVVFIVNAVQHRFPAMRRSDPLPIPVALIAESLPEKDTHLQEERRLFYVACTRAKEELSITYSDTYEGTKKWKPSVFVAEILTTVNSVHHHGSALPPPQKEIDLAQHRSLRTALTSVQKKNGLQLPKSLSHSQLETFERCPWQYALRYIYRVPEPQHSSAIFGMVLHDVLRTFYAAVMQGKKTTLSFLEKTYTDAWRSDGFLSHAHMTHQKKHGWEMLENFYKHHEKDFGKPVALEKSFTIMLAGVRLTGRIDRIDQLPDGTYKVIDYKTGKIKTAAEVQKDLQLSVYALACAQALHIPLSQLALYYLENQEELLTTRSQESLKKVTETLTEKIHALRKSDFSPTPGMHCGYCPYRILCDAV